MRSYLSRYQQGECEQVWQELYTLGTKVHQAEVYPDAWAVAIETMKRVHQNVEVLIPRLEALGYQFGYEWVKEEWLDVDEEWIAIQPARSAPPPADIAQRIQRFEELAGPLPLSLRAFYGEVGEVNFFGRHLLWDQLFKREKPRGQPLSNLDPLAVKGLDEYTFEDYVSWRKAMQEQGMEASLYPLMIALDSELKYNISGSGAYEIEVPNRAADAMLLDEWHHTTFVNYLRICLHYGGLPGLQYISHLLSEELAYLRKDLLTF
jgi:hypothetical protein